MKSILIFLILLGFSAIAQQDSVKLSWFYQKVNENYPAIKQKEMINDISSIQMRNIGANNNPSLSINGQATYQSDVTSVNIIMPEIPGIGQIPSPEMSDPEKDQYKISFDVSQPIWDGGITRSQKVLEKANLVYDLQTIEVDMYQLSTQINNLYFAVLTYNLNLEILNILKLELGDKIEVAQSLLRNGVSDSSSVEIIMAEILKIDQQIIELQSGKLAAIKMLQTLVGESIDEQAKFLTPVPEDYEIQGKRPEIGMFDLGKKKIEAGELLINRKNYPKIFGFGQLGYGKPGLNMLSNEFDAFYIVGAKLSWNISDFGNNSREKQILEIRKDILGVQEEIFLNAIVLQTEKENTETSKWENLYLNSKEIFLIRESIAKRSSSKFSNGVISSNDLISDINAKAQAMLNMEYYKLQLIKAKINLLTINGNLKFDNDENKQ